jgi:hypothetical protein
VLNRHGETGKNSDGICCGQVFQGAGSFFKIKKSQIALGLFIFAFVKAFFISS